MLSKQRISNKNFLKDCGDYVWSGSPKEEKNTWPHRFTDRLTLSELSSLLDILATLTLYVDLGRAVMPLYAYYV
jgi:hypothetical protein